jgi:hypothetical protein
VARRKRGVWRDSFLPVVDLPWTQVIDISVEAEVRGRKRETLTRELWFGSKYNMAFPKDERKEHTLLAVESELGDFLFQSGGGVIGGGKDFQRDGLRGAIVGRAKGTKPSAVGSEAGTTEQLNSDDLIRTLERLGELRDAGLITEEEFAQKKADILSRL